MARLFITPREMNFISDITKEVIKDVIGQKIYYYSINELKTLTHEVYNEALHKVFDSPIEIDCLVDTEFQAPTKTDAFGVDAKFKIEVYLQHRDLVDKGIRVNIGDFFSYSNVFYEITERVTMRTIYGQAEHRDGIKLIGVKAREDLFKALTKGPTDVANTDADAVQETFVQQRGLPENRLGKTNDKRDLVKTGVLDGPLDGAREVSPAGTDTGTQSSFYDDEGK